MGHLAPHWLGALGTALTIVLLSNDPGLVRFSLAIVALTLSLNFWLAYMLGSVSKLDISGRYSVLTTAALGAGATIGPAIAGLILQQADMLQVLMAAGLLILAGFSGITMALKRSADSLAASN